MRIELTVFVMICLVSLSGCGSKQKNSSEKLAIEDQYILSVSQDGEFRPPNKHNLPFQKKLDLLLQGIDDFLKNEQADSNSSSTKKNILIYIHGGLNSHEDALERAEKSIEKMKGSNTYPIFITWRSGYSTTLGDHYFRIRHGETSKYAAFTSPIYIIGDIFRTIGNIPMSWYREGYQIISTNWLNDDQEDIDQDVDNGLVDLTTDQPTRWNKYRKAVWGLTAPVKLITTPFVFTLGAPAWNNMNRRTLTMFVSEDDLKATHYAEDGRIEVDMPPSGAAYLFLKKLNEKLKEARKKYPKFEVTLMGHSMGAIVINQALLRFPEFTMDNIVYMASADSLQNYLNVTNILFNYREKKNLNVYNLHLHPENENREINAYGAAPSGSLLAWIDHSYGQQF